MLPRGGTVKLSFSHELPQAYLLIETEPGCFLFVPETDHGAPEPVAMALQPHETDLLVSRKGLLAALKSATALDRQRKGRTFIALTEEGYALQLNPYPEDPEIGTSSGRVSLERREGAKIDTRLSWKRFKTLIESVSSGLIRLQVGHTVQRGRRIGYLLAEPVSADGTLLFMEVSDNKETEPFHERAENTHQREQALPSAAH